MSGKKSGEVPDNAEHSKSETKRDGKKPAGKQRVGDVARALRSIYDDTLRESVPDDFKDLLGKLN